MGFVVWFLACIGGLVTFFAILLFGIMLFYDQRSRALHGSILQVLHEHPKQEFMTIAEITQALQTKDTFPARIPKLFGLYAPDCLTTDACRTAMKAGLLRNIGNLLPCYQLSSMEYTPPKWP